MRKVFKMSFLLVLFSVLLLFDIAYAKEEGNLTYSYGVTSEMSKLNYWIDKLGNDPNRILLNHDEISKVNKDIIKEKGNYVVDLTKIREPYRQAERKKILLDELRSNFEYMAKDYQNNDRKLYADGQLIDNEQYINRLKETILETGFVNDHKKVQIYTVAVKRADIKLIPTSKVWGYDTPEDPDDEALNSVLEVNEPFVVRAKCEFDGETFYWGLSNNCSGWVNAKDLAICKTKKEWIDAWKVDINKKDFLVVLQDKIALEESILKPKTSGIVLYQGTILKLVLEDEMPTQVGERATWYNYVVYLPTRDQNGNYVKEYALIPQHLDVNVGYLPLTRENILRVAFNSLGNRYGWGGMLGATDCSSYCKAIYKCFGLDLPRNTGWQIKIPYRSISLMDMTDQEKRDFIRKLPVGTLLYMDGHVVMFIGNDGEDSFVINNMGSLVLPNERLKIKKIYSVAIVPLSVERKNGKTFLQAIDYAVIYDNDYLDKSQSPTKNIICCQ